MLFVSRFLNDEIQPIVKGFLSASVTAQWITDGIGPRMKGYICIHYNAMDY